MLTHRLDLSEFLMFDCGIQPLYKLVALTAKKAHSGYKGELFDSK